MKTIKRTLALVLILLLVFSFAACGKDKVADTSVDEVTLSTADINLVVDGESAYRIVRSIYADETIFSATTDLFKYIKENLGITPKNVSDDEEQGENAEILIGDTNRPETAMAKQMLREQNAHHDSYIIASIEKSIVICGLSDESTINAVEYFKKNFVKAETITGGINCSYNNSEAQYDTIKIGENADLIDYVIVKPRFNLSYITTIEIEKLQKTLLEKYGYVVKVINDVDRISAEREIIIGNADREGVVAVSGGDKVSVKVDGGKVFLNGGSTYSVAAAVTKFNNLINADGNVALTASNGIDTDYETVAADIDTSKDYKLTFKDAFDGDAVDLSKWNNFNDYDQYGVNGKWAKRAKKDYSNVYVQEGRFYTQICMDDEAYYGSMLTTQNKMAFKYGYFEISQIMPKGQSFWTSLWTRPAFATSLYWTEIDVNENFGTADLSRGNCFPWLTDMGQMEGLTQQGGTLCWENDFMAENKDLYSELHTYGCEWTYDDINFYRDGKLIGGSKLDDLHNSISIGLRNQHAYLIVGCVVGSDNLTAIPENSTEEEWNNTSRYIVDDITVYQKDGMDIQFDYKDRHYGFTTKMYYND